MASIKIRIIASLMSALMVFGITPITVINQVQVAEPILETTTDINREENVVADGDLPINNDTEETTDDENLSPNRR